MDAVEPVPDRDAHQEHKAGDDPVVFAGKSQRVVVRQHHEDDRQRQVVVMRGPQLGDFSVFRIGRAARDQVGHDDLLVRDDDQEHIRRHDRRGEGAKVQKRRAAGKDVGIAPGHHDKDEIKDHHQCGRTVAQLRLAKRVVKPPAKRQRADRDRNRLPDLQVHHVRIDKEQVRTKVIDKEQKREARQPGRVAFPFEPDEVVGHPFGGHQVFLDMVEAAAMNLPFLAVRAACQVAVAVQAKVERDEVEGRPDPGDRGDDMQPPHREFQPVAKDDEVVHAALRSVPVIPGYTKGNLPDNSFNISILSNSAE